MSLRFFFTPARTTFSKPVKDKLFSCVTIVITTVIHAITPNKPLARYTGLKGLKASSSRPCVPLRNDCAMFCTQMVSVLFASHGSVSYHSIDITTVTLEENFSSNEMSY